MHNLRASAEVPRRGIESRRAGLRREFMQTRIGDATAEVT